MFPETCVPEIAQNYPMQNNKKIINLMAVAAGFAVI